MNYFIIFLLLISLAYVNYNKSKKSLHMIQQNLYNENNRYIKWLFKSKEFSYVLEYTNILILAVIIIVDFKINAFITIAFVYMIIANIINGFKWNKKIKNDQNKKKLVVTARIKRLVFTEIILIVLPIILLLNKNLNILLLSEVIISVCIYFVVFIAMIINMPVEKCVYLYYKTKAQNKLKKMNNLKIIGITGSYGKTSSKRILSDILNIRYNALPTPKNLNTYNGLIMTVNNYMDKFNDIFIAEMGAYVRGEIAGLCRLVKPQYGILTKIGTAHLDSFGSEENIIKGKFELIESLPQDGFAILNGDDPKQVNYKLKNKIKTIWIGIDNKDADVLAKNIKCTYKGTQFDLKFKNDDKKYKFETKLLGKHNVYNILAAIACGREFGIEIEELERAVKSVNPIEHRLELKKLGNFYQIDDAYNSNPEGAKNACEILGMMPGYKIMVTPGMIELSDKEEYYNEEFGKQIAKAADLVILVGKNKTLPIKKGLEKENFDQESIIVINDVREAYTIINRIAMNNNDVYALFENDLPDTYNEK